MIAPRTFQSVSKRNEITVVQDKIKLCTYNIYPFAEKNVLKVSSPLSIIEDKTIINDLDGWGQSFTLDFFLHYTGKVHIFWEGQNSQNRWTI